MIDIFLAMIETAKKIGTVTDANMYDFNFLSVSGKTVDGSNFSISLNIREEAASND